MNDSILTSTKKVLGIGEYDDNFDTDVIMHINTVLSILQQLGVGPRFGFSITGDEETWSDFLEPDDERINTVKTYVYLRVRLLFDPPTNSFVTMNLICAIMARRVRNGELKTVPLILFPGKRQLDLLKRQLKRKLLLANR